MNPINYNPTVMAINGCHDSSVTFVDKKGNIRVYELERFTGIRYCAFKKANEATSIGISDEIREAYINSIKKEMMYMPSVILHSELDWPDIHFLEKHFPEVNFIPMGHHMSHCAGAYLQSPFNKALVFSLDGGGRDYISDDLLAFRSYSFYLFDDLSDEFLFSSFDRESIDFNPGIYGYFGSFCSEIKKPPKVSENDKFSLSYAGKIMGLSAYGKIREDWIEPITKFYLHNVNDHWNHHLKYIEELSDEIGISLTENCFSGQTSYDLAATNQFVFEKLCMDLIIPVVEKYDRDVVFSGGSALNVLLNQRLAEYLSNKGLKLFIPPTPSDCGLSLGHYLYYTQTRIPPLVYSGYEILDESSDTIQYYYDLYNKEGSVEHFTYRKVIEQLLDGNIGAVIGGLSEVGPRALGNRSIIALPSVPNIKDKLNSNVKFREFFRPFAPVCLEEDMDKFFNFAFPSPFMSHSPVVKQEIREKVLGIVHEDGTARLQTVNKSDHKFFYELLKTLKETENVPVLLNTSFNIKGRPILTRLKDAFEVLEQTGLDFLVYDNLIFYKK